MYAVLENKTGQTGAVPKENLSVGSRTDQEENSMFDRFREMDSYEEINELAKNLLEEGDVSNIFLLAKENGISKDCRKCF